MEVNLNPAYSAQEEEVNPWNTAAASAAHIIAPDTEDSAINISPVDIVPMTPAESQAAFIGGYTPSVIPEAPSPQAVAVEDPLTKWYAANSAALKKKDADEASAKKASVEKAKAFLTKCEADRKKAMEPRKPKNRADQKASPDAGVPEGKTWEKVFKLTDFTHDKPSTKDLGRMKAVLTHCKTIDVKISA